jgi:hypothetical protein
VTEVDASRRAGFAMTLAHASSRGRRPYRQVTTADKNVSHTRPHIEHSNGTNGEAITRCRPGANRRPDQYEVATLGSPAADTAILRERRT